MHDPMTVAFEVRYPWFWRKYRPSMLTIWHVDPECDGSDDSCGWFIRGRHMDKTMLKRVVDRFEGEWDRVFKSDTNRVYLCGLFAPNGDPHLSVPGIVLNMFFLAACEYFNSNGGTNWRKARRFMQRRLFDILLFAENTTDSLVDGITRKYETACGEQYTPEARRARIEHMAECVLTWIARADRPWYRHPRWHIRHWKIQIHPLQAFKRWVFSRCEHCGGRFKWGEAPCTNSWHGTGPLWFRSEKNVHHGNCSGHAVRSAVAKDWR